MHKSFTGTAVLALLLAGCGRGSDKPAQGEATGSLRAGGISGLHYATPTRSGETDAAGSDPANGISVDGRAGALLDVRIDLGLRPAAFAALLQKRVPNLSRLSLRITYDPRHNATLSVVETDSGLDSTANERQTIESIYDARDRLLEFTNHVDHDADGVIDSSSHTLYEYAGDGVNATRQVDEQDFDDDGRVDERSVNTTAYDGNGDPIAMLNEYDFNADGRVDFRTHRDITYDADRRVTSEQDLDDKDGDGAFDQVSRTRHDFDAIGNPLLNFSEFDETNDGQIDFATRQTYTYGLSGEALEVKTESRSPGKVDFTPVNDRVIMNIELANGVQTLAQDALDMFDLRF